MSKYKTEWKDWSNNEDFWREVLEGRVIKEVKFDDMGVFSLILDSDEEVFLPLDGGRISISD